MVNADIDEWSVVVVDVYSIQFIENLKPLGYDPEDGVLTVQCHQVVVSESDEKLLSKMSTSEWFKFGPRFAVPTRPFFLILKSVWISSRKNLFSGPCTILNKTQDYSKMLVCCFPGVETLHT